jgi:hypothetical protein
MDATSIIHNVHSVVCTQCTLHTHSHNAKPQWTHIKTTREKKSFKHIEIEKVKWKAQVHYSFKGLETSWMCKGLVATCKLRVFSSNL